MTWYFRAETKGIQNWILSTPRLRELRGGSAAIERATSVAQQLLKAANADIHQAAAGAIACTFPSRDDLIAFASVWPYHASKLLPGLQVIQAWHECASTWPTVTERQAVFSALGSQRNMPLAPTLEGGPLIARNARTGLPATSRAKSLGKLLTDESTTVKEFDNKEIQYLWAQVDDIVLQLPDTDEGLIAVVHADGTGVGKRVAGMAGDDLKTLSAGLAQAAREALECAVKDVSSSTKSKHLPLQVVVCGGDDLTFISSADIALPLVRGWLTHFESLTSALPHAKGSPPAFRGLRAGAGIAVASARHPFIRAYNLAEELAKIAKRAAKDATGAPLDSVIALRRTTTSFDTEGFNQGVWRLDAANHGGSGVLPTVRHLDEISTAAKTIARGGIRQWLTAFEEDIRMPGREPAASGANLLWDRMLEVGGDTFRALVTSLARAGAATNATTDIAGIFSPSAEGLDAWTPLRDALLLNTIARRSGGTEDSES